MAGVPRLLTLHFLSPSSPGDGDLDSRDKLPLELGVRELQSLQLQGHCPSQNTLQGHHSRVPTLLSPHFLIWATHGNEDLWQTANRVRAEVRI